MKLADIDWGDFCRRAAAWEGLSPDSRTAFLNWQPGSDPPASRFGADIDLLIEERFVSLPPGAATVGEHPDASGFVRAVRALFRLRRIWGGAPALEEYIRDHTTRAERDDLLRAVGLSGVYGGAVSRIAAYVSSTEWVDRFLHGPIPHAPASPRAYAYEAARDVVRELVAAGEPVPFRELPGRFPDMSAQRLSAALRTTIERLVLFPAFTPEGLVPVITLWPPLLERLHRAPGPPPEPLRPSAAFARPFLFEDMASLLVAASAEPPRFRQADGELYVRDYDRLAGELQPLSDDPGHNEVLEQLDECDLDLRIYRALATLERVGMLRWGRRGQAVVREPTPAAREWLVLPATERLRAMLQPVREQIAECRSESDEGARDPRPSSANPGLSIAPLDALDLRGRADPATVAGLADAFETLPEHGVVPLDDFLTYHVPRGAGALAGQQLLHYGPYLRVFRADTPEERERVWADRLIEAALRRLVPFGAIRVAAHEHDLAIGLTPIGRYLFGMTDDLEYSAPDEADGAVVVQPDFEIVLTGPAPLAEVEIARFAERIGRGIGAVFRITRASVFAAAAAGLSAGSILRTLRTHAGEVPGNVEREIVGWVGRCRRVTLRTAVLVQCPDEETAARVAAAAGEKARRLGPTVVELVDTRGRPALERKLAAAGIALDQEPEEQDERG
ncbi:MAG: helicase-associated domain-containing protein [Jiangellaceae bacterium]